MLALQGIHIQEHQILNHPQKYGIGLYSNQFIEAIIDVMQTFQKNFGQGTSGWLNRLFDYLDLYCVGRLLENEVDLTTKESNHFARHDAIWNSDVNKLYQHCIDSLPLVLNAKYQQICLIQFADDIDDDLLSNDNDIDDDAFSSIEW